MEQEKTSQDKTGSSGETKHLDTWKIVLGSVILAMVVIGGFTYFFVSNVIASKIVEDIDMLLEGGAVITVSDDEATFSAIVFRENGTSSETELIVNSNYDIEKILRNTSNAVDLTNTLIGAVSIFVSIFGIVFGILGYINFHKILELNSSLKQFEKLDLQVSEESKKLLDTNLLQELFEGTIDRLKNKEKSENYDYAFAMAKYENVISKAVSKSIKAKGHKYLADVYIAFYDKNKEELYYHKAIKCLNNAIALFNDKSVDANDVEIDISDIHYTRGCLYGTWSVRDSLTFEEQEEYLEKSKESFERAVEINENPEYYTALAITLAHQKDINACVNNIKKALAIAQERRIPYNNNDIWETFTYADKEKIGKIGMDEIGEALHINDSETASAEDLSKHAKRSHKTQQRRRKV